MDLGNIQCAPHLLGRADNFLPLMFCAVVDHVGYLGPEKCDDVKTPCEYNPTPSFDNLKNVYHNTTAFTNVTYDTFVIPKDRQGRTICPKMFPKLSSFRWKADRARDLMCPLSGSASNFTCPANLDELMTAIEEEQHKTIHWTIGIVEFLVLAAALFAIYELCMWVQRKANLRLKHKDTPAWMTIVVPSVGRDGGDSDSQSDESTGLLSMQNWTFGDTNTSKAPYQSVASVASDLTNLGEA